MVTRQILALKLRIRILPGQQWIANSALFIRLSFFIYRGLKIWFLQIDCIFGRYASIAIYG